MTVRCLVSVQFLAWWDFANVFPSVSLLQINVMSGGGGVLFIMLLLPLILLLQFHRFPLYLRSG